MRQLERPNAPAVVKVGGSLYDLPDLGRRLTQWLAELAAPSVVLVPGGGVTADAIRELDRHQALGEDAAHRLALRALTLNAYFLAEILPTHHPTVTGTAEAWPALWSGGRLVVLDAEGFARADEDRPGCLPHRWDVTSDSVAARVAGVVAAGRLMLLKSVTIPAGLSWTEAGHRGLVDPYFGSLVADAGSRHPKLEVRAVNLREWQPTLTHPESPPASAPGRGQ